MSRESKILSPRIWGLQETISHYESFGWELLSVNGNQITMSRETQNPVYPELVMLQASYEEKLGEYERLVAPQKPNAPTPIDIKTCLITFVCLVIPFAAYITYKIIGKKKYNEAMQIYNAKFEEYESKKKAIKDEMRAIILQGKTTFFSKQN
jgi:hypothetical protein